MKIKIWGARGSLPSPGPDNIDFGGNTSCIEVSNKDTFLVLDAGSGVRRLGVEAIPSGIERIDILLTHLHLDHIMGLGFFEPLYNPAMEVNIWGPAGNNEDLQTRLTRYLSPPLFPIRLQDLPCKLHLYEIDHSTFEIGSLKITSEYICHPGPTVGFRIENGLSVVSYMPDHEPALGSANFPHNPQWTSGYEIAKQADLLLHDAQFTSEEYAPRVGWGHSSCQHALDFANMAKVKKLMLFHHDPSHTDEDLRSLLDQELKAKHWPFEVGITAEGDTFFMPE